MNTSRFGRAVVVLVLLAAAGCSTVPQERIWRPWTRADGRVESPGPIAVSVHLEAEYLPGSTALRGADVQATIETLLARRGFAVSPEASAQYKIFATVRSTRADHLAISAQSFSTVSYSAAIGAWQQPGAGVAVATILGSIGASSKKRVDVSQVQTQESYTHALSVEISLPNGELVWVGESTWDSPSPDVRGQIRPAVQVLFSSLPQSPAVSPAVPEVQAGKGRNYFDVNCGGSWFACPALPYRIAFSTAVSTRGSRGEQYGSSSGVAKVQDPYALAAFVDLVETAEYALPLGSNGYGDPLNAGLWKKAQIGAIYDVGSRKGVRVLVDLEGRPWGYQVVQCRVADDAEWAEYAQRMSRWRKALEDYFDFFVDSGQP